jgi:hypothetical protein
MRRRALRLERRHLRPRLGCLRNADERQQRRGHMQPGSAYLPLAMREAMNRPDDASANDNKPIGGPLSLDDEIGHAVMALAQHEHQLKRMVMVHYPNEAVKPLGELLMRLGQFVQDVEREKLERARPRLVLPSHLVR